MNALNAAVLLLLLSCASVQSTEWSFQLEVGYDDTYAAQPTCTQAEQDFVTETMRKYVNTLGKIFFKDDFELISFEPEVLPDPEIDIDNYAQFNQDRFNLTDYQVAQHVELVPEANSNTTLAPSLAATEAPAVTPTAPEGAYVANIMLVDAENHADLFEVVDGGKIYLGDLPTTKLSIRADTVPQTLEQVKFFINDEYVRRERLAPYTLRGDSLSSTGKRQYASSSYLVPGTIKMEIKPYETTWTVGNVKTVTFEILDGSAPTALRSAPEVETSVTTPDPTQAPTPSPTSSATGAPSATTAAPSSITGAPSATTATPSAATAAPSSSTGAPSAATGSPSMATAAPSAATGSPSVATAAPSAAATPASTPAPVPSGPYVSKFILYDSTTNKAMDIEVKDGTVLNLSQLPQGGLNIEAITVPHEVSTLVKFYIDDSYVRRQSYVPYMLGSDDFNNGSLNIKATSQLERVGPMKLRADIVDGGSLTVNFDIIEDSNSGGSNPTAPPSPVPTPQPTPSGPYVSKLVLYDAEEDEVIRDLKDGDVLNLDDLPDSLSIEAVTVPASVGTSVAFWCNGVQKREESASPYFLAGDWSNTIQDASILQNEGPMELRVVIGNGGGELTINLNIEDDRRRRRLGYFTFKYHGGYTCRFCAPDDRDSRRLLTEMEAEMDNAPAEQQLRGGHQRRKLFLISLFEWFMSKALTSDMAYDYRQFLESQNMELGCLGNGYNLMVIFELISSEETANA